MPSSPSAGRGGAGYGRPLRGSGQIAGVATVALWARSRSRWRTATIPSWARRHGQQRALQGHICRRARSAPELPLHPVRLRVRYYGDTVRASTSSRQARPTCGPACVMRPDPRHGRARASSTCSVGASAAHRRAASGDEDGPAPRGARSRSVAARLPSPADALRTEQRAQPDESVSGGGVLSSSIL